MKKNKITKPQSTEIKTETKKKSFNNIKNYLLIIPVLVLTAIIYLNSIENKFVNWDDNSTVYENKDITGLSSQNIKKIFTSYYVGMYQPVTTLSYAIEYNFYKLKPKGYHTTNLLFHLINTLLVFLLIFSLTGKKALSLIVMLFFGIHPMHVESVAWVTERKDLLYTLFFLLSLMMYISYCKQSKKIIFLIFSFLFFILSVLSKSSAIVLPLVLFLIDYYYKRKFNWKSILEKLPFLILSVIFGIISLKSQQAYNITTEGLSGFSIPDRILMVCYSFSYYIINLVLPLKLSVIHPFPEHGKLTPLFYLAPALVIFFIVVIRKTFKEHREILFGALFYLINVILILQIIPVGQTIVAERYSYVSCIGIFLIAGYLFEMTTAKNRTYLILLFSALTLVYSIHTSQRIKVWENSETLFSDVINKYPTVATAWYNRGQIKMDKNDLKGAAEDFTEAVILRPARLNYLLSRASVNIKLTEYSIALDDYNKALELPNNDKNKLFEIYYGRGLAKSGLQDNSGALKDFNAALKIKTDFPKIYSDRGAVRAKLRDLKGALEDFNQAIKLDSSDFKSWTNRASAKGSMNDLKGAAEDIDKSIELNPGNAEAYYIKGMINYNMSNDQSACESWNKAAGLGFKQAEMFIQQYCK